MNFDRVKMAGCLATGFVITLMVAFFSSFSADWWVYAIIFCALSFIIYALAARKIKLSDLSPQEWESMKLSDDKLKKELWIDVEGESGLHLKAMGWRMALDKFVGLPIGFVWLKHLGMPSFPSFAGVISVFPVKHGESLLLSPLLSLERHQRANARESLLGIAVEHYPDYKKKFLEKIAIRLKEEKQKQEVF